MKKLKKPVSILLTFVMVFGLFASIPFYVSAAGGDNLSRMLMGRQPGRENEENLHRLHENQ